MAGPQKPFPVRRATLSPRGLAGKQLLSSGGLPAYVMAAMVLWAVAGVPLLHAESLVNGGFESWAGGVPTGWVTDPPEISGLVQCINPTSPFTGVYPLSHFSAHLQVDFLASGLPLAQNFSPFTGTFSLSFDFMLDGLAQGERWQVTLGGLSNPSFYLGIQNGMFRVSDGVSYGNLQHAVLTPNPGTWYHVVAAGDPATFTYSGYIMPFGGARTAWAGLKLHAYDGDTRNLVVANPPDATTGVYLDNFSVVPEPHSLSLLALGFACVFFRSAARTSSIHAPKTWMSQKQWMISVLTPF